MSISAMAVAEAPLALPSGIEPIPVGKPAKPTPTARNATPSRRTVVAWPAATLVPEPR